MKYLVTIRAHYFEIDKPFEKIIRSYFQERMTDFLIFHEGTESSLSVFLKEDLPDEVRTELTTYFNIRLNVFKINQPIRAFNFQQIQSVKQFEKDMVGLYTLQDGTIYPYVQFQKNIHFLNPIDNGFPSLQKYHTTAIIGCDISRTHTHSKKVIQLDYYIDCFFDYISNPASPPHFLYELFQIQKSPYLNLNEFRYSRGAQNGFSLYYGNDIYKIIIKVLGIKQGTPYGDIDLIYYDSQPFKSKAYTKRRKESLEKYFLELTKKEGAQSSWLHPHLYFGNNLLSIEGINLHNPDYYALVGCILDRYDEKFIPICFDIQNIKESCTRFQSFETLYRLKDSHKLSA